MAERRSQYRLTDAELVMIGWDEGSKNLKQLGNVDDVSLDGMKVRGDYGIPVGAPVTISYGFHGDEVLTGTVRHQVQRPDGFSMGIEFDALSKNSSLHFRPELLVRMDTD